MANYFQRIPKYWLFQAMGWGTFVVTNAFFALTFDSFNKFYIGRLFLFIVLGVVFTHLMRMVVHRLKILQKPLNNQIIGFLLLSCVFALIIGVQYNVLANLLGIGLSEDGEDGGLQIIRDITNTFVFVLIWSMIYFVYHYVDKSRKAQVDTLKLQALVKELELKTIKSHINPHFIFNALNSIRALIDENPGRAREAITELSNILRSSMQAETVETVPLTRELGIVRDYLALEHIRFEDRLQVEYDIDEDTLNQPVPYMMLQTLVENAIKHGISKNMNGGLVKIISDFKDDRHELIVRNTGKLNGHINKEGFGLQSTSSRLGLLFGPHAVFEIHDLPGNIVEAKVSIPIQN